MSEIDRRCISTLRMLAADAVQQASSGHPGMPMGAAAMACVLWTGHLRRNPKNPGWPDRDRFVLSAGHGGALVRLDRFGASAPWQTLYEKLGFTAEAVAARARRLLSATGPPAEWMTWEPTQK